MCSPHATLRQCVSNIAEKPQQFDVPCISSTRHRAIAFRNGGCGLAENRVAEALMTDFSTLRRHITPRQHT